jgi:hypothetical protein
MKIEYTIDRIDFLNYQLFAASKSERVIKSRKRSRILVPIVYLFLGLCLFLFSEITIALIFISFGLIWYFMFPFYTRRRYIKHFEKYLDENFQNRYGKAIILIFEDEYITSIDYLGESKLRIKEITNINEIPDYCFIKLSSGESLIVPTKKINNLTEFDEFIKHITTNHQIDLIVDSNWKWK